MSPQTVLLRTTLTRTITIYRIMIHVWLLCSNHLQYQHACIFSTLTSIHILWYKLWEFAQTSSYLIFGDYFFHSDDLCVWSYGDIVSFADFSTALRNLSAHAGSHKRRTVSFLYLRFIVAVQYNIQYNLQQSQTICIQSDQKLQCYPYLYQTMNICLNYALIHKSG